MATLIRLKQIESSSLLIEAANLASNINATVNQVVSESLVNLLPTNIVTSSAQIDITQTLGYTAFSASLHSGIISASNPQDLSIYATKTDVTNSINTVLQTITFDAAILQQNITNLSSSVSSSINSIINNKGIISSSHQLDGTTINNLTLSTTGDAYSLIVSGAVAIVDTEINISGSLYNVPGELWINGETGSAGNAPINPYDNQGNAEADIIDQGEW